MAFVDELAHMQNIEVKLKEPMKKHTTFGVGGEAKYFVLPFNFKALIMVIESAKEYKIPYKILGAGSNVLVSDKGYRGIIISTNKLNFTEFENNKVRVSCGVKLNDLIEKCSERGLSGIENLYGIPASVGGSVFMNAGTNENTISDFIEKVCTVNEGILKIYSKAQCKFGYRKSVFKKNKEPILSVVFNLKNDLTGNILNRMKENIKKRKALQPEGNTCGCVFTNPENFKAGELIEKVGLKGYNIGGAKVSEKHANFISANNFATAKDIFNLIKYIKEKVFIDLQINLKEEVEYIGDFK